MTFHRFFLYSFSSVILFISSELYSYFLLTSGKELSSLITISFILVLFFVFIINFNVILKSGSELSHYKFIPLLFVIMLQLGILAGFYFSDMGVSALWVIDSYQMHIPGSTNIANYLMGSENLREQDSVFDKIYFTHLIVGIFFVLFGINAISSGLALMMAKVATTVIMFHLGKRMFDEKIASIAILIYSLSPISLFYTITFYKEAIVQLLIIIIYLCIFTFVSGHDSSQKYSNYIIFLLSLLLIMNERFYLFPIFMFTGILLIMLKHSIKAGIKCLILLLGIAGGYIFYNVYSTALDFSNLLEVLKGFRSAYHNYSDVDPINIDIPYSLAFLKFIFTPFFTLNKFDIFDGYSYLLIWGSFLGQIIMVFSLFGMYKNLKLNFSKTWFMLTPFFIFLLIFSYISPFNGRIRDSFLPLIAIYSAYGIKAFSSKLSMGKNLKVYNSIYGGTPDEYPPAFHARSRGIEHDGVN
ncbi:MAG: hypothetical protein LLH30_08640 [Candidatus Manganitrophus sp. SA1]|nr:hypothetical protein [Candidatus Manganitrophus morganii]